MYAPVLPPRAPMRSLFPIEKATTAATLWTCIQEVLGPNLGQDTGYHDTVFVVLLSPFKQVPQLQYLNFDTTASFQILSSSSFTKHSVIRRCMVCILTGPLN
jgi:hypothetical protein